MEVLYDNLDNYNDINIIQELRSENQDLKHKLEEKTLAIDKLQNDYDHLNMEFKKLEINYSSLLKTARAEIERKTQIISNLNIEKDMIVLNAMQNGTNIRRNFRNTNNFNKNTNSSNKQDDHKVKEETQKINDMRDRKAKPGTQSNEVGSTILSTEKLLGKLEPCREDKLNECKENHIQQEERKREGLRPLAGSIRNRRKSMPVGSLRSMISDDESDQKYDKETIQRDILPVRKLDRRFLEKADDHASGKASEYSDERNFNHEPLRESYRNRQDRNRYHNSDRVKNRHRQDNSQRSRKHSPIRAPRRYDPRSRHRVLESPPVDPYLAKTWYSRHERNIEVKPRFEDKQAQKHKIVYDNEPLSKRHKIEENRAGVHEAHEKSCDIREPEEPLPAVSPYEFDPLESCQSPDYAQIENALGHTVKEIRNVAAVPLDDPRIRSGKYLVKTDADGKTTLSTITGRNVDCVPVNKSRWNLEHVDLPPALVCHPSTMDDEIVEKIYSAIDNVFNMSLESGEIFTPEDDALMDKFDQEDCHVKKQETVVPIENTTKLVSKVCKVPKSKHKVDNTHDRNNIVRVEKCMDKSVHEERTCNKSPERLIDRHDKLPLSIRNKSKVLVDPKDSYNDRDTLPKGIVEGDLELSDDNSDHTESSRFNFFQNSYVLPPSETSTRDQISKKDIVSCTTTKYDKTSHDSLMVDRQSEKDRNVCNNKTEKHTSLPCLSTSASENVNSEINSVGKRGCTDKKSTVEKNNSENGNLVYVTNKEQYHDKADKVTNGPTPAKSDDNHVKQPVKKGKASEDKKKSKSKKCSSKTKEPKGKEFDNIQDKLSEIKTKPRKVKEKKPKEIKEKFSDLFGDSGSLITPEDLGLGSYVPMLEDAQDAADVNINDFTQKAPVKNKKEIKLVPSDCKGLSVMLNDNKCANLELDHQTKRVDSKTTSETQKDVVESLAGTINIRKQNVLPIEINSEVFENLQLQPIEDKPDVVKTVIISTGTQPQISLEAGNPPELTKLDVAKVSEEQAAARKMDIKKEYLRALATSTPYKEFQAHTSLEKNMEPVDTHESSTQCESSNSTVDTLTKADEPDVRIIVRRRRKVVKKPAVT